MAPVTPHMGPLNAACERTDNTLKTAVGFSFLSDSWFLLTGTTIFP